MNLLFIKKKTLLTHSRKKKLKEFAFRKRMQHKQNLVFNAFEVVAFSPFYILV